MDNKKKIILLIAVVVVIGIVVGGYFFKTVNEPRKPAFEEKRPVQVEEPIAMPSEELEAQELVDYALSFVGKETDYDSSAFVQHVFKEIYDVNLPRTSREMRSFGEKVSGGNLELGDLIFFDPSSDMGSVVGIYIGNSQFIYSSSSSGKVKIKDLKRDGYHAQRYQQARKVNR